MPPTASATSSATLIASATHIRRRLSSRRAASARAPRPWPCPAWSGCTSPSLEARDDPASYAATGSAFASPPAPLASIALAATSAP